MANSEDYSDDKFLDDFSLKVSKKKPQKQLQIEDPHLKIKENIKQLPITTDSMILLKDFVEKGKIKSIGEIIKADEKSVVVQAVLSHHKSKVVIEIFTAGTDVKVSTDYYSRKTQIGSTKSDVYKPMKPYMKFMKKGMVFKPKKNIVIRKDLQNAKTLKEFISENPTKIVKIFKEILNFILDIENLEYLFWSQNSNGAKNIFWRENKWIVLSGDAKQLNSDFRSNLTKVLDLFLKHGMTVKQLENEFRANVSKRNPRKFYDEFYTQYFQMKKN